MRCELADLLEFRKILHASGKFMLCHNGGTWRPQSLREQYRIPDGFMNGEGQVEVYNRLMVAMMGASMARPTQKLSQMYMGTYCLSAPGQPSHARPWGLENTSEEDGDEVLMDGFGSLAAGSTPLYTTLNRLYFGLGDGSARPAQEVFEVMKRIEPLAKDSVPVPYVTLVPSWEALQLWRTGRQGWNEEMSAGFALAMLDEHLSLDVCPSLEVTASWLEGQRVIALCGASGLTNDTARLITDWVKRGGGLLATYDTGLYDQNGKVRQGGASRKPWESVSKVRRSTINRSAITGSRKRTRRSGSITRGRWSRETDACCRSRPWGVRKSWPTAGVWAPRNPVDRRLSSTPAARAGPFTSAEAWRRITHPAGSLRIAASSPRQFATWRKTRRRRSPSAPRVACMVCSGVRQTRT